MADRTILHVDMDAFFVSVELLDRPELRGRPVVVGGAGARGVVAAASYEARAFGVRSAMPSVRARRLCPDAVFLHGRYQRYHEVSRRVMAVFGSFTPLVEPIALDEAFLDVTGAVRLHGDGRAIGEAIRGRIRDEEGLTCSVGIAPVKFVAKLASEAAKPRATPQGPAPGAGIVEVERSGLLEFLRPLTVASLWGVGPATLARLDRLGVSTVADLAATPMATLMASLGASAGRHLHELANGIDDRSVTPDRELKSVSHEETFAVDLVHADELDRELLRLGDAVASRLRAQGLAGRVVTVKVRFHDFATITRSVTLPGPADTAAELVGAARGLVRSVDPAPGVRLLGLAVGALTTSTARQLSFDLGHEVDTRDVEVAVDEIRRRFGDDAIGPAALLDRDGLRLRRRGDDPWGHAL